MTLASSLRISRVILLSASCLQVNTVLAAKLENTEMAALRAQKSFPDFAWDLPSATQLDINQDGAPDLAFIGYVEKAAAVAVVLGPVSADSRTLFIDFGRNDSVSQRAMCAATAMLEVYRQDQGLEDALGETPEGYKLCAVCQGLTVVGEDRNCDPINIYWNHATGELGWWRA